jgi:biotin operon repressor
MKDKKTDKTLQGGVENSIQNSIMRILGDEPLSTMDIAAQIDFPRQKIYYHIKNL